MRLNARVGAKPLEISASSGDLAHISLTSVGQAVFFLRRF